MAGSRVQLSPELIKQILTLRYSIKIKSKIPKMTWLDFVGKKTNTSTDFVEKAITDYIRYNVKNTNHTKVALALSGGVDSTLVLNFLIKSVPDAKIKTLSVKFGESFDETKQAAHLAEKLGVDHQVIFLENYLRDLPKAISIVKLPIWDLHWYYLAKKAKSISQIIVSGDGGDELFGGYTFRYKKFLSLIKKNPSLDNKIVSYLRCHERDWINDQEKIFGTKISFSWKEIHQILKSYFDNPLHPLGQVFLADFNGKLRHNFSVVNSALNDHFKIKTVTPLLSKKITKYATHIPIDLKYNQKSDTGKLILRKIIQKEGLEQSVSKSKQGFSIDTVNLWKSHGREICDHYLSNARTAQDGWINQDWIDKRLRTKDIDVRTANKFYGLLAFEIWYRMFITEEMKSGTKL